MRRPCRAEWCLEADLIGEASTLTTIGVPRDNATVAFIGPRLNDHSDATPGDIVLRPECSVYTIPLRAFQTSVILRGRGVLPSMSVKPYSLARAAATKTFPV
jgi:hypothetical protein